MLISILLIGCSSSVEPFEYDDARLHPNTPELSDSMKKYFDTKVTLTSSNSYFQAKSYSLRIIPEDSDRVLYYYSIVFAPDLRIDAVIKRIEVLPHERLRLYYNTDAPTFKGFKLDEGLFKSPETDVVYTMPYDFEAMELIVITNNGNENVENSEFKKEKFEELMSTIEHVIYYEQDGEEKSNEFFLEGRFMDDVDSLEKAQQYSDDVQKLFKGEHVADSYRLYK